MASKRNAFAWWVLQFCNKNCILDLYPCKFFWYLWTVKECPSHVCSMRLQICYSCAPIVYLCHYDYFWSVCILFGFKAVKISLLFFTKRTLWIPVSSLWLSSVLVRNCLILLVLWPGLLESCLLYIHTLTPLLSCKALAIILSFGM